MFGEERDVFSRKPVQQPAAQPAVAPVAAPAPAKIEAVASKVKASKEGFVFSQVNAKEEALRKMKEAMERAQRELEEIQNSYKTVKLLLLVPEEVRSFFLERNGGDVSAMNREIVSRLETIVITESRKKAD